MAEPHPYRVGAEEPGQAAEPLRFDGLPREVQSEVLKWTHARFEVAHHTEAALHALGLSTVAHPALRRLPFVPVVLRYEFNLQRRLADGPVMTARFSRSLDRALQHTALWPQLPLMTREALERHAENVVEIEPFSRLRFDELNGSEVLFCFLRGDRHGMFVDLAPRWTRFLRNSPMLEQMHDKMENVFCQPFRHV
jgi:hypothetical protein